MNKLVRLLLSLALLCVCSGAVMAEPVTEEPEQTEYEYSEPEPAENSMQEAPESQETLAEHPQSATETMQEADKAANRYRFGQEKAGSGDDVLSRAGNSSGVSLGKIAISLAFVIFLVLVLGWTFKKLTQRVPGSQHMKVISSIPLGQKERLLVIEIQGKQRVLGVTPQQINFLFELEESLPEEKLASEFHSQLQSWLKK
ncbi:MAG: flagellar biosynthetic protein FliO [Alkalimonas sp.]|nr:flagellar biosynthetic protein FliO [Alkalimonas sp.]